MVLVVVALTLCSTHFADSPTSAPRTPPAVETPLTAAQLAERVEQNRADNPVLAYASAQQLIERFPQSPEAEAIQPQLGELEQRSESAAAEAAERAEQQRAQAERRAIERKWRYSHSVDQMSSGTTRFARISSENQVTFQFPYGGAQRGGLMLRDHPRWGREVLFTIERGQILCWSYRDCDILVRFDEEQARTWKASGPDDNSTELIFLRNADDFRRRMRSAKTVRISVPIYQQGSPVFEFHVEGYDHDAFQTVGQ